MRVEKKLTLGERNVTVKELTVAEVRAWMESEQRREEKGDLLRDMLIDGVSFADMARMSDLSIEEMEQLLPSELQQLADACAEANRVFFNLCARVAPLRAPAPPISQGT
ncbi:MAG: hypothetical protein FLDDKLPJ_00940 [Phycisphaerae bacterium]|nr:hypothetical protein [Phycisphaerae bacterium]